MRAFKTVAPLHIGLVVLASIALVGCASSVAAPGLGTVPALTALPAEALPGHAAKVVELDATLVASDAVQPQELQVLLEDAGFVGGRQRTFSNGGSPPRRLLARVLQFGDAAGATAYLGWLREHASDVIGTAAPAPAPDLPEAFLAHRVPSGCCHQEVPIFLAAWRRGSTVLSLQVAGAAVTRADVPGLASAFDRAIAAEP